MGLDLSTRLAAFLRGGSNGNEVGLSAGPSGDLYTVKRLPDFGELVLEGKVWKVQDLTTTVVLNDVLPTVTSGLTAQNPTSDLYYVVFAITGIVDVSPASLGAVSFSHASHKAAVVPYTRDVALTAVGGYRPGQGAYSGQIILDRGATVGDDGWTPVGDMIVNNINSQTWMSKYVPLHIPVIIPPLMHYSIGATGNDATFEAGLGLVWAELKKEELYRA